MKYLPRLEAIFWSESNTLLLAVPNAAFLYAT